MNQFFRLPAGMLGTFHKILDPMLASGTLVFLYSIFSPSSFVATGYELLLLFACSFLLTLLCFNIAGVYRDWAGAELISECNRIVVAALAVFGGLLILGYVFKVSSIYSRSVVLSWIFIWPALMCIERIFLRKFFFSWFFETRLNKKAVIAGSGTLGARLAQWIDENPWAGINVEGFFDREDEQCNGQKPCLGKIEQLPEYVKQNRVQLVYLALPMREEVILEGLLRELEDSAAQIYFFPDMSIFKRLMGGDVAQVAGQAAIALRSSPFEGINGFIKRAEDIILSTVILMFISPLMILIALGIKLTSKGPVFFRQWRYGLGGEPFQILKFRTMKVLEDGYEFVPASRDDPRITAFGRFLRKNSLDELPQFINVLMGSMSIVGPRPHAVKMNEEYRTHVPGYMLRHISRPGITGLAQVNGSRGEIRSDEEMYKRILYDIEYLQKWSVFLDLEIILRTVFSFAWRQ